MMNSRRPTAKSAASGFNPSTTHPASISASSSSRSGSRTGASGGGNTTQKREHVTFAASGAGKPKGGEELAQSGGGAGGGVGAGSNEGMGEGEGVLEQKAREGGSAKKDHGNGGAKAKGKAAVDVKKVHPASLKNGGGSEGKSGKDRESKL